MSLRYIQIIKLPVLPIRVYAKWFLHLGILTKFFLQSLFLTMCYMPSAPKPKDLYYIVTRFWKMRNFRVPAQILGRDTTPCLQSWLLHAYVPLSTVRLLNPQPGDGPCRADTNQANLCQSLDPCFALTKFNLFGFVVLKTNNILNDRFLHYLGYRMAQLVKHCATSQKVAGSIPDGHTEIFDWFNPSGRFVALGSTQPVI